MLRRPPRARCYGSFMVRWLTAMVCGAALTACHPMRAAIDRGELSQACRIADDSHVPQNDPERDRLHALLTAQMDVAWNIERVSLLDLLPPEAVSVAAGLDELRNTVFYRFSFEAKALPAGSTLLLTRPALESPAHDETLHVLTAPKSSRGLDDVRQLLRAPWPPTYETVPAQSLPREYVEEREPGKWVYRGNVDPGRLTLAVMTGGLSAIFLGPDLGREAQWVPLTPRELQVWNSQAASRRKSFEREEAARLAEGRKVVEAVLARNQATKARFEQQLAAHQTLTDALTELVRAEPCSDDGYRFRLGAGRRCSFFASTWDRGPPLIQTVKGKAMLELQGELRMDGDACGWLLREQVPVVGDETLAPLSQRVFSNGPRRMQPVRRNWHD